ncbi:transmembrane protein [Pseudoscourfieldia marina]
MSGYGLENELSGTGNNAAAAAAAATQQGQTPYGIGAELGGGAAAQGSAPGYGLERELGGGQAPGPSNMGYGLAASAGGAPQVAGPTGGYGLAQEVAGVSTAAATIPTQPLTTQYVTPPVAVDDARMAETVAIARARVGTTGGGLLSENNDVQGRTFTEGHGGFGETWRTRLRELYARPRVAALMLPKAQATPLTHNKIASNVLLQQLLTYHVYYSIAWAVFMFHQVTKRHWRFGGEEPGIQDRDEIRTAGVALWIVFEPLRLYWGFVGNLRESPPAIVAFLIVTFFPCTPVCLYLLFDQRAIEPIDKAVSTATLCFLAAEICAGIFAMYSIVRTQSEQFLVQEARLRAEGRL